MYYNNKDKSDKECIKKINERKPIMYIKIRHNSLETSNIGKNKQTLKDNLFLLSIINVSFITKEAWEK